MDEHRSPFSFPSQAFLFPAQTGIVKRLDRGSDNKAHAQTIFNEHFQSYTRTRTGGKNELKTPTYGRGGK